jgi:hypothetical protein
MLTPHCVGSYHFISQRPLDWATKGVVMSNIFTPIVISVSWADVLGFALTLQSSGDDEAAVECLIDRLPEGPELAFCLNRLAERELR